MEKAKITLKGQITIPKKIRKALSISEGDSVIFSIEGDHAVVRPLKKRALEDFFGSLPATRPYAGIETIRKEVHEKIAKRLQGSPKK